MKYYNNDLYKRFKFIRDGIDRYFPIHRKYKKLKKEEKIFIDNVLNFFINILDINTKTHLNLSCRKQLQNLELKGMILQVIIFIL